MKPAKFVVDANVVFAALVKRGFTFEFIRLLPKLGFKLYSPAYALEEINGEMGRLSKFSKLSRGELEFLMGFLFKRIEIVPKSRYGRYLPEAKKLLPRHPEDSPYLALAIALDCPLWSNERRLKRQSKVKVSSTSELKSLVWSKTKP